MDEKTPPLDESGLPAGTDRGEGRPPTAAIYLTRRPTQATPEEAVIEWQNSAHDTRFRVARMLYPYEYWSQPRQEGDDGRAFILRPSDDDLPPMPGQSPVGVLAAVSLWWRMMTRGFRACAGVLSSLAGRWLSD